MNKFVLVLAIVLILAACNNSKSTNTHAEHAGQEASGASALAGNEAKADTILIAEVASGSTVDEKIESSDKKEDPATAKNPFTELYNTYFELKDALAQDNGEAGQGAAKKIQAAMEKINVNVLDAAQGKLWKQYPGKLAFDSEHIAGIVANEHQREHFVTLSKNMYALMKSVKPETPVYYQQCPMYREGKNVNWLSKQKEIQNPYLGKSMPSCGSTVEIIQ